MNIRDHRGNTALTLSSRHGRSDSVRALIDHGARTSLRNNAGHSALELSQLFQHKDCYEELVAVTKPRELVNFFDHSPLNRSSSNRGNTTFIASALASPNTRFILFHHSKPVASHKDQKTRSKVFKAGIEQVHKFIEPHLSNVVFLGLYENPARDDGKEKGAAWFAIDVKDWDGLTKELEEEKLDLLQMYPDALMLGVEEAAICGHARSLMDWHHRLVSKIFVSSKSFE